MKRIKKHIYRQPKKSYLVRLRCKNNLYNISFSFKKCGSAGAALKSATTWRDEVYKMLNVENIEPTKEHLVKLKHIIILRNYVAETNNKSGAVHGTIDP